MTRILVCYHSRTGTTERMAREIAQGMRESGADVDLLSVEQVDTDALTEYQGIVLGSPTYYGLPSAELKALIDESVKHHGKLEWKVGGAFTSSANPAGGNETTVMAILESLLVHGMIVKGDPRDDHYGPVVIGEADEEDLKRCRDYGRRIAELTQGVEKWISK